jgi:preprotein translocase subunit SecA
VGTTSIENSELISNLLRQKGIEHKVLNAKHHEQEAHIVAQAGMPGAVTIATNMAGRGTDIVLGGSLEEDTAGLDSNDQAAHAGAKAQWEARHQTVVASGGLHVIGSERHESRRVDNQLRGRSGRQGDPGSSRFYLSLEDPLMRIFASDRVSTLMQRLGMKEGESIEHPWVTRAIENAQRKVEARNFDIRKQLLEYDNVANDQRRVIYHMRDQLMKSEDISETIESARVDAVAELFGQFIPPQTLEEQWDVSGLEESIDREMGVELRIQEWLDADNRLDEHTLQERVAEELSTVYAGKVEAIGTSVMRHFEKTVMLQVLDDSWKEHLAAMDHLRQGIHLRGYAQKDPKQEYKKEAFEMFTSMIEGIKHEVIGIVSKVQVHSEAEVTRMEEQNRAPVEFEYQHADAPDLVSGVIGEEQGYTLPQGDMGYTIGSSEEGDESEESNRPYTREGEKVGRNDPCPCGSGKKYKVCHGKLD